MINWRSYKKIIVFSLFCFLFWFVGACSVQAASLYLSPSSGSYNSGGQISVGVFVSSADQAMNAVSGQIKFSADRLSVSSISKSGSIMSMWVQDPTFSNSAGTINFEGIVFNPGYQGKGGKILTIVFKTKQTGKASASFASGDVLANDGSGTSILSGMGSASFNILGAEEKKAPVQVKPTTPTPKPVEKPKPVPELVKIVEKAPGLAQVFSTTHPDQQKWYKERTLKLVWGGGAGITAVRFSLDKDVSASPSKVFAPAIFDQTYNDLEDGVYYFHIQLKNNGGWGPVATYRAQIDGTAPESFTLVFPEGTETDNDSPSVKFNLSDEASGIAGYRVTVDGQQVSEVKINESNQVTFSLSKLSAGKRNIGVEAFDAANNVVSAFGDIIIRRIKVPLLIEYPNAVDPGMPLVVSGLTYPSAEVRIWWKYDCDQSSYSRRVLSDEEGNFVFAIMDTKEGVYRIWAEAIGSNGKTSQPSATVSIPVELPWFLIFGRQVSEYLLMFISIVVLVLLCDVVIWLGIRSWHKRMGRG